MNTKEVLIGVRTLLGEPEKWTQGWFAKNAEGEEVLPKNPEAKCWCLLGALDKVAPSGPAFDFSAACSAIRITLDSQCWVEGISSYNDHPGRTHQEILDLLDRTIEMLP